MIQNTKQFHVAYVYSDSIFAILAVFLLQGYFGRLLNK